MAARTKARPVVEIFSKADFEAALPVNKQGQKLWQSLGQHLGEETYVVRPFPARPYAILVRSSVGADGQSKASGEDSIRARVVVATGNPESPWQFHGGKSQRWVTRVRGWQGRMTVMLRKLANQVDWCRPCPKCGTDLVPFTSQTATNGNKGKGFVKCCSEQCQGEDGKTKTFFWTDDDDKDPIRPPADMNVGPDLDKPKASPFETADLERCPNCGKNALGSSRFGGPGSLYCFPRQGGCGWKGSQDSPQPVAHNQPAPTADRPAERKPEAANGPSRYNELRRLTVAVLEYLDNSPSEEPLGASYHAGGTPVEELKHFLRHGGG